MTTYVLMVFIFASNSIGGNVAISGHFYDKEACEVARNTIINQELPYRSYAINAYCFKESNYII